MSPQEFGAQIRQRRHEHHLSIAQLAALIAISPLSLRNMERGEFEPLDNQAERVLFVVDRNDDGQLGKIGHAGRPTAIRDWPNGNGRNRSSLSIGTRPSKRFS